jgi:hypothetical protein
LGGGGRDKGQSSFVFVSAAIELMAVLAHTGPDINSWVQYARHLMSTKDGFGQNQPEIQSRKMFFQKTFILKLCIYRADGSLAWPTMDQILIDILVCQIKNVDSFKF